MQELVYSLAKLELRISPTNHSAVPPAPLSWLIKNGRVVIVHGECEMVGLDRKCDMEVNEIRRLKAASWALGCRIWSAMRKGQFVADSEAIDEFEDDSENHDS